MRDKERERDTIIVIGTQYKDENGWIIKMATMIEECGGDNFFRPLRCLSVSGRA